MCTYDKNVRRMIRTLETIECIRGKEERVIVVETPRGFVVRLEPAYHILADFRQSHGSVGQVATVERNRSRDYGQRPYRVDQVADENANENDTQGAHDELD